MKPFRIFLFLLILLAGLLVYYSNKATDQISKPQSTPANVQVDSSVFNSPSKDTLASLQSKEVPTYVVQTLSYILNNHKAPEGYVGGRNYQNRNKALPLKDERGNKIFYREWDVHPKVNGRNRGAERLVTGSNQTAYFTKDHYNTFIKIKL